VIGTAGALLAAFVVLGYVRSLGGVGDVPHARAMALAVLTLGSAAVTVVLAGLETLVGRLVTGGTIALSVLLVQTPALATLLHVRPLHVDDWAAATAAAALAASVLALARRL
jgi:Ca2+-transporting ATPase